jgi:hypothetical protein
MTWSLFIALAFGVTLWGGTPRLIFTKTFPGSVPEYVCVNVDRTGALEYKESPNDNQPLKANLQIEDVEPLFAMAQRLDYFRSPVDSGLKVANTGRKVFRYEGEDGAGTEVSFNYSTNETAQQLLQRFEQIAATERAYLELDRTVRYDKLGVNDALASVELLWVHKQLAGPQQFLPLLTRIETHDTFMHLVRDRAAKLRNEFEGEADKKQK